MALSWIGHQSRVVFHRAVFSYLFIIYINDIDIGLNTFISRFADDAKIGNSIVDDCDRLDLQEDFKKNFTMVQKMGNAL